MVASRPGPNGAYVGGRYPVAPRVYRALDCRWSINQVRLSFEKNAVGVELLILILILNVTVTSKPITFFHTIEK